MDNYRVIYENLPCSVRGLTLHDVASDYFTIILNSRMSHSCNLKTFQHELIHVENGVEEIGVNINLIECLTH